MFCSLCRLTNSVHPTNAFRIWNCGPNIRYRPETVKVHFKKDTYKQTMHKGALTTKLAKYGRYFAEKEKEEEKLFYASNEKVFTALYWLCKQEIAQSKLNSLLEMLESLGEEEVKQIRERSSTVLRDLLLTIVNQIKIGQLDKIRKSPFFGILTEEVTDISNVQNLVTFIK